MGTAVRPAKTFPGLWDAFAGVVQSRVTHAAGLTLPGQTMAPDFFGCGASMDRRVGAAARLPKSDRQDMAIQDENRRAEDFVREVDAGRVLADNILIVRRLDGEAGRCRPSQVDVIGERPVIQAGRLAITANRAVHYGEICHGTVQAGCGDREKHATDFGAGETHRDAAKLNRLAARRVALVRSQCGVAGPQIDAVGGNVEFVGGDL
jgi:hypothetical protein